jgi:GNAT superfamily N-acetyltransferase
MERWRDGYLISTDLDRIDRELVHGFLRTAYWSPNVPREVFEQSIEHSLVFGLYDEAGAQAGFARVVTDHAVFAYLADVFVLEAHRGRGLGLWLIETVLSHPDLQALRRIALGTKDAHDLYARFGFQSADSEILMTLDRPAAELYGGG